MAVQARVTLQEKRATPYYTEVTLTPVYSNDPNDPNKSYSDATPSGSIQLSITNKAAVDAFEFGKTYDVLFTEVADA